MQTKWIILGVGTLSCALLGGYVLGAANTAQAHEPSGVPAVRVQPCAVTTTTRETNLPRGVEAPRTVAATQTQTPVTHPVARDVAQEGVLRIRRIEVGTGVEAREPTGVADHFSASEERLFVFLDVANRHGSAQDLTITFEPEHPSRSAQTTGLVTLHVPADAARHRTWAWSRNVHAQGNWSAVVRDEADHVVGETHFEVE